MKISLAGHMSMDWNEAQKLVRDAEELGFDEYYTSDHLMGVAGFLEEKGVIGSLYGSANLRRRQRSDGLRACAVVLGLDRPLLHAERLRTRSQGTASGMLAGAPALPG